MFHSTFTSSGESFLVHVNPTEKGKKISFHFVAFRGGDEVLVDRHGALSALPLQYFVDAFTDVFYYGSSNEPLLGFAHGSHASGSGLTSDACCV